MPLYSDINAITPTVKPLLEDFQAVYQALIILFNTRPGEILFFPEYGIDLEEELFELIDNTTASLIYNKVFIAVQTFEPRVLIDNSNSSITAIPEKNRFDLVLQFSINGLESTQNFEVIGVFNAP